MVPPVGRGAEWAERDGPPGRRLGVAASFRSERPRWATQRRAAVILLGVVALTFGGWLAIRSAEAAGTSGSLSTTTPSVTQGTSITFSYSTTTANSNNWIGIYSNPGCGPVNGTYDCGSTEWAYAPNQSGTLTFATASLTPGNYVAYYLYNNGYTSLAPPADFTVTSSSTTTSSTTSTTTASTTTTSTPSAGSLSTTTPSVTQGTSIAFSYSTTKADTNSSNWIGIYSNPGCGPVNGTDVCASTEWAYAPNQSGTLTFATSSLAPGNYVAYYLYNNGYTSLAPPVDFTVTAVAGVAAPTFVSSLTTGGLNNPVAVAQGANGDYWVVNAGSDQVQELDPSSGAVAETLGAPGTSNGDLENPSAVAVTASDVFVADTGNNRVEEWTTAGAFVATIGAAGTGKGDFSGPDGVAVSGSTLYVSDDGNNRIETFKASTGAYSSSITADVSSPAGLTIDSGGNLWAAQQANYDSGLDGVVEYNSAGSVLRAIESNNSTKYGGFTNPTDVAVNGNGHIFVAQPDTDYLMELTTSGVYLNEFATSGSGAVSFAAGVTMLSNGDVLVADTGNDRLVVFQPAS
jgi:hypothetical protein